MPFMQTTTKTIFYQQYGKGKNIFLIAGFGANHLSVELLAKTLAKTACVTIFDNRGSGQSFVPEQNYLINNMAEDIIDLMNYLSIPNADFVGISMGGAILQQLLIEYARYINNAVIISSFAKIPAKSLQNAYAIKLLADYNFDASSIYQLWLPWLYSNYLLQDQSKVKAMIALANLNPYPQTYAGFLGQLHALEKFDCRQKLATIQNRTLILVGDEDILTPPICSKFIQQNITNAKLTILPNAAHCMHIENYNLVAEHILEFLN